MRRPEEGDHRVARKVPLDDIENEIDGRGGGLGRQRQRVGGLVRNPSGAQRHRCEIEIRERTLVDHGGPIESADPQVWATAIGELADLKIRTTAFVAQVFRPAGQTTGHGNELFFTVSMNEPALFEGRTERHSKNGPLLRCLLDECGEVDFVEARQPVVDPLMKSRPEKRLGCHHVDALDTWHSCQQIEIGHEQTIRIGNPVGHRHDNVPEGRVHGVGSQTIAQHMLVACVTFEDTPLVFAECSRKQPRLKQHPGGAAIDLRRPSPKSLLDQLFEPLCLLALATQLVVEAEHLGDEPGPKLKGKARNKLRGVFGRCLRHRGAFHRHQQPRRVRQPLAKPFVQLIARDEHFESRPSHLARCASGGNDHQPRPFVTAARQRTNGTAKGMQIGDADQPRPAR